MQVFSGGSFCVKEGCSPAVRNLSLGRFPFLISGDPGGGAELNAMDFFFTPRAILQVSEHGQQMA